MLHEDLTSQIIASFYGVYNALGYGFLEKVYENALLIELRKRGLTAQQQIPIQVYYDGQPVGEYFADILVNGMIILELKVASEIILAHEAQLVNYLKATNIEVGFVLNFGPKAEFKRKISSNMRKQNLKGNKIECRRRNI